MEEVQNVAATIGTSSQGMTVRAEGCPRICRPASFMMAKAAKYKAAMGNSDVCAAMEIVKIEERKIRCTRLSLPSYANRNAARNNIPAKMSGINRETNHGKLVSAANAQAVASR